MQKKNQRLARGVRLLAGFLSALVLAGCGRDTVVYLETQSGEPAAGTEASADMQEGGTLCVYVCGAVVSPGVYTLAEGSRVCDAILAAGGFLEGASETYWNQAEPVYDGEMIEVPTQEELSADTAAQASAKTEEPDGRVNINTATKEELMELPGVGESKAEAILRYREENGGFGSIEEIMNVSGIKEASFEKIRDYIRTD